MRVIYYIFVLTMANHRHTLEVDSLTDDDIASLQRRVAYDRDPLAYRQLFLFFHPLALRFCLHYLPIRELAEEAVSDVMLKVWGLDNRLANVRNLRVYILTAVKNKALDYRDSHRKYQYTEEISPDLAADSASPEELVIAAEYARAIDQAIDNLPPKCKAVFLLVRESKASYREAAEIMGISENTVSRHIQTAVKQLSAALGI